MTTEIYALDLDWDLILHLAIPESVKELRAERLDPTVIEDELASRVFRWQLDHFRQYGEPATASVLEDEFPEVSLEDPQTAIGDLIERLRLRYARNEGREAIKGLTKLSGENPAAVGNEMLRVGKRLTEISSRRGDAFGTGDLQQALDIYEANVKRGPGPTLGFPELDEHFHGIRGVTILLAPPKTYKSWFGVNNLIEGVMSGERVDHYSLELPAEETKWRVLCMAADVPYWKYERGCLDVVDMKRIQAASSGLDSLGVYNVEKPPPGERAAQVMVERSIARGADYVIIDQLQYIDVPEKGRNLGALNDTGYYWEVLSMLRDYSDEIPIFLVHQFNRSVLNAKEMPEMQQAKGSAAIEETAHLVLGLWANKEMRKNNTIEVGTLASRTASYKSWHIEVGLSRDCRMTLVGEVTDDDD